MSVLAIVALLSFACTFVCGFLATRKDRILWTWVIAGFIFCSIALLILIFTPLTRA